MVEPDVSQISLRFSGDKITKTADVRFLICGEKKCHPKGQWQEKKNHLLSAWSSESELITSLSESHTRAVRAKDHQGAALARIPMSGSAAQEQFLTFK